MFFNNYQQPTVKSIMVTTSKSLEEILTDNLTGFLSRQGMSLFKREEAFIFCRRFEYTLENYKNCIGDRHVISETHYTRTEMDLHAMFIGSDYLYHLFQLINVCDYDESNMQKNITKFSKNYFEKQLGIADCDNISSVIEAVSYYFYDLNRYAHFCKEENLSYNTRDTEELYELTYLC